MAQVWLARMVADGGFQKYVALKLIRPELIQNDSAFLDRFSSEARLGGLLHHVNIVQTLDFGRMDDVCYMALEYVRGHSLDRLIAAHKASARPIPLEISLRLLVDACRGLGYAHDAVDHQGASLGVVHRDIKPSNLMVGADGILKVADFGLARASITLARTRTSVGALGTLRYMSPEQAQGDLPLDRRTDVFSLGAVLFELVTLQRLYDGENPFAVIRCAQDCAFGDMDARLDPIPLDPRVKAALQGALQADPERRIPTAQALARQLRAVLSELPGHLTLEDWLEEVEQMLRSAGALVASFERGGGETNISIPTEESWRLETSRTEGDVSGASDADEPGVAPHMPTSDHAFLPKVPNAVGQSAVSDAGLAANAPGAERRRAPWLWAGGAVGVVALIAWLGAGRSGESEGMIQTAGGQITQTPGPNSGGPVAAASQGPTEDPTPTAKAPPTPEPTAPEPSRPEAPPWGDGTPSRVSTKRGQVRHRVPTPQPTPVPETPTRARTPTRTQPTATPTVKPVTLNVFWTNRPGTIIIDGDPWPSRDAAQTISLTLPPGPHTVQFRWARDGEAKEIEGGLLSKKQPIMLTPGERLDCAYLYNEDRLECRQR